MDYSQQRKFFETSYNTGTDHWSRVDIDNDVLDELTKKLSTNAFVLDVGSGRGKIPFVLAEKGFRVIGLDYIKSIVQKNNEEVKNKKLGEKLRFIEGDIFDIPLSENSFDAVVDIGLLQHIDPEDWQDYRSEVMRVLKSKGYFLVVALLNETEKFMTWFPSTDPYGDYERDGVFYHFFDEDELMILFEDVTNLVSYKTIRSEVHGDKVVYAVALFQKN
jgi:ubiquinone/menaquinone biosynthesis C-methylase UbiE